VVHPPDAPSFLLLPGLFTLLTKKARLGCLGIRLIFCLGDILILGSSFNSCLGMKAPLAVDRGGVHCQLGKADIDQLLFSGDDLGLDRGVFGSALGQVGASAQSSIAFPQLSASISPSGHGPDRPCCCLSQCSFSPSPEGEVYSSKPQLGLFSERDFQKKLTLLPEVRRDLL
jgi:hypothetical protein